jgi:cysteine desulfurase / selenocysteine lyase
VGQTSVVLGPRYLDYELKLRPNAGRFEPGYINQVGIAGVEAAVDLFNRVGMEQVEARVLALTGRLIAGLDERGCEIFGARAEHQRAGVVSFRHRTLSSAEIVSRLREVDVVVSEREDFVRVSPHFYNTEEEVDRLLAALPR